MIGLLNFPKVVRITREIRNYFSLLSTLDNASMTDKWKELKLRKDWVGQTYTVISLREEDMGEMEEIQQMKVLNAIRPINEYLSDLHLAEIIIPTVNREEGTRSWVVKYVPKFDEFSILWVMGNVVLPIGILYEALKILI